MKDVPVVITGIGLVSALGVGVEAHVQALKAPPAIPPVESERYAPFAVHPLPEIDWNVQIPKRGDQRQMETWQRLGVHTAGMALDHAGIKGNEALCATMDMIVAAGGGERDVAVDETILERVAQGADPGIVLNATLSTDLRPTLFLAQLSNLLAGNISIVHKVTGSSRTFMGEEAAGITAIEHATARIRSGQSTHALVGGAFNAEHPDMFLIYEVGRYLDQGGWKPVWDREASPGGGVITGSGAAFLVLESEEHARSRGATVIARIAPTVTGRARRSGDGLADAIGAMAGAAGADSIPLVISGSSGAHAPTRAERAALAENHALRAFSSLTGHLKEAQFPFAVALAALAVSGGFVPPSFGSTVEKPLDAPQARVLATTVGHHRGEGMVVVEPGEQG
jgi:3-oxoacyl-[acyl-carrier-protein] synthase II